MLKLNQEEIENQSIFQSILWGLYYPDTKASQNYHKKTNIPMNSPCEHRHEILKEIKRKPNLAIYKKDYTL